MKNLAFTLLILIFLVSCEEKPEEFVGKYHPYNFNTTFDLTPVHHTLYLHADGTVKIYTREDKEGTWRQYDLGNWETRSSNPGLIWNYKGFKNFISILEYNNKPLLKIGSGKKDGSPKYYYYMVESLYSKSEDMQETKPVQEEKSNDWLNN